MGKCVLCNLDNNKIENTIIEETRNFYITPALGALVDGYILIISKRHISAMSELNDREIQEYIDIIKKYREIFKKIYNKYPIVFEHGTSNIQKELSAGSVIHAHTHIVNHNYKNEKDILKDLNFKIIYENIKIENNRNYIFYTNPKGENYITYEFKPISQVMRILISEDLGIKNKYDWKKYNFIENVNKMLEKFKNNKVIK